MDAKQSNSSEGSKQVNVATSSSSAGASDVNAAPKAAPTAVSNSGWIYDSAVRFIKQVGYTPMNWFGHFKPRNSQGGQGAAAGPAGQSAPADQSVAINTPSKK